MTDFIKFLILLTIVSISVIIASCSDDSTDSTKNEFIANDNSFAAFTGWTLVDTIKGIDPATSTAHGGNDSTVLRRVYFKDNQARVNEKYPVGTLIVKHSQNSDGTYIQYSAMVKRGNGFNPSGGDWEWFLLASDGKILRDSAGKEMRGATLNNSTCLNCHTGGVSKDFVFTKD